ncbi:hypothetical protein EVAR_34705_1 [Eumeta japonica]|uniref:Uncharacterized protein n=1 Tax=Eumeta variegata TaxID=151549 RepID=A0A4C1XGP3_EUMVA|nr:hypothetical protein EVAR_34705_1 [Eumeta japonica]
MYRDHQCTTYHDRWLFPRPPSVGTILHRNSVLLNVLRYFNRNHNSAEFAAASSVPRFKQVDEAIHGFRRCLTRARRRALPGLPKLCPPLYTPASSYGCPDPPTGARLGTIVRAHQHVEFTCSPVPAIKRDFSQGYAVPEEAGAIFGTNQSNANNREPSPSPSVCSSKRSSNAVSSEESDKSDETIKGSGEKTEDEREFIKVRWKLRKVARRQNPNKSDSTDLTNMEVDKNKGAPTVKINTSTSTNSS